MNRNPFLLAACAALLSVSVRADSPEIAALLAHPILDPKVPLLEVQACIAARVPAMPKVKSLAEWERFAAQTRRDVLEKIVFRGEAARQWRDAKTKVEWLETIEGGPGYHVKKLRYEALPGMWIPALLYEPDQHAGKIPVHLAVNGHDPTGKATPYIQLRCINLAKRGIATLNPEFVMKGQLSAEGFRHYRMNQLDLCGASGLAPFYLAMARGLDLLLALPYADAKRVAMSGLSGGGWQTVTLGALDPRVTLANPVAGYSSFRTRVQFPSDLGDSEQAPNDLATVADYTHLTAMLAGRAALLTYNAKDNCCYGADHALGPLEEAAAPIFALYGQPGRLRTHVNDDPGTHNFEVDNRQAFYRVVGAEFFPGDANFPTEEIASESEVKTRAQLDVALPEENRGFHELAAELSKTLPRDPDIVKKNPEAARARLAEIVKFKAHAVTATKVGSELRGEVRATFWKLRMGDAWTVPAVELVRGAPRGTVILVADQGRAGAAAETETLLATGQRVLAVDPFYFGESKIAVGASPVNGALTALMVAAVGERPLGIQASEVAAAARWASEEFQSGPVSVQAMGPRSSTFALIAAALEPRAIAKIEMAQPLASLREVIESNWMADEKPELFCFGLLETFDMPQLRQLAGAVITTR